MIGTGLLCWHYRTQIKENDGWAFDNQWHEYLKQCGYYEWMLVCLGCNCFGIRVFYTWVRRCDAYTPVAFSGFMPLTAVILFIYFYSKISDLNKSCPLKYR